MLKVEQKRILLGGGAVASLLVRLTPDQAVWV